MFSKLLKAKKVKIDIHSKYIYLSDRKIEFTLRLNPRSKSIRISINSYGELSVSAPKRVSQAMIEHFILLKQDWILEKISDAHKKYRDGDLNGEINIPQTKAERKAKERNKYLSLKDSALKIATEKVHKWNAHYNFKFNKISIKNQKTRWGSCSKNGNLNFSYKIAIMPEPLADYLVVHEVCHLGQFNHSAKFWALVSETIPNYKELRAELRKGKMSLS